MTYIVRTPTERELKHFYESPVLPHFEGVWGLFLYGDKLVATAGVLPDPRFVGSPIEDVARTIGFLDVRPGIPLFAAMDIVRHLRAWLRQNKRTVWVQHDDQYPHAERMLRALGFQQTQEKQRDFQNTDRQLHMWCRLAQ